MKLICDANIVIGAHELNIWNTLTSQHTIYIGSAALKEPRFFEDSLSNIHLLNLRKDLIGKKIKVISLLTEEVNLILEKIRLKISDIHFAEVESLAALLNPEYQGLHFCTADKAAVLAASLLSIVSKIVSLEKCIRTRISRIPYQYSKKAMKRWKAEAVMRFGSNAL